METDDLQSNTSELIAATAIKKEDWQPEALGAPVSEIQELAIKMEPLQCLQAEIESSDTVPVGLIPQTHECLKAELILDDELLDAASLSQESNQDILEKAKKGSKRNEHSLRSNTEVLIETQQSQAQYKQILKCELCPLSFRNTEYLSKHMATHAKDKNPEFACQSCGKSFCSKGNLVKHMRRHAGESFNCEVCGKNYTQKHTLKKHMLREHSKEKQEYNPGPQTLNNTSVHTETELISNKESKQSIRAHEEEFACQTCGKTFPTKSRLYSHKRTHDNRTYDCLECGAVLKNKRNQIEHMLRRHPREAQQFVPKAQPANADSLQTKAELKSEEEFIEEDDGAEPSQQNANCPENSVRCEICHNIFQKELISTHIRLAHRGKTYSCKCKLCGRVFTQESLLTQHMSNHIKRRKKLVCQKCGRKFSTQSGFYNHKRAHDRRMYECRVCGAALKSNYSRIEHMLRRHPGEEPQKTEEEPIEEDNGAEPTQQKANWPEDGVSCEICHNTFQKELLSTHIRLAHRGKPYPCKCKLCGRMFTQESLLTRHMRNHTRVGKELACQICGRKFSTSSGFYNHMRVHDTRTFECQVCGAAFKHKRSRNEHLLRRHPGQAQRFVSSPQTSNADSVQTKSELKSEEEFIEENDGAESTQQKANCPDGGVRCEICHNMFQKEILSTHIRLAHRGKPYPCKCKLCGRIFTQESLLTRHMSNHTKGGKELACQICEKTFSNRLSFYNHKRVHDGRTYKCRVCGAAFTRNNSRVEHMLRRHPDVAQQFVPKPKTATADSIPTKTTLASEEKFLEEEQQQNASNSMPAVNVSCEICHNSYSKELFGAHRCAAHSDKAHKCAFCSKSYTTEGTLKHHMTTHAKDTEKEKTYKCELCPKFLKGMKNLKRHTRTHAKDRKADFACRICGETFSARSTLHDHRMKAHTDRTYDCRVCGAAFKRKTTRNEHMVRRHPGEALQISNADAVQTKTELKSEEEFLEEDDGAAPTQQSADCPADSVRCEICHSTYTKELYSAHRRVAHYEKTLKCEMCPKYFHRPSELKRHMETHTTDRKPEFACQVCGKTVLTQSSLNRHIRKVHDRRALECRVRGAVFKQKKCPKPETLTEIDSTADEEFIDEANGAVDSLASDPTRK